MKKIASHILGTIFGIITMLSCTALEPAEMPIPNTVTEISTKSTNANQKNANLEFFFYNSYSEDIIVTLKRVDYCIANGLGDIEKINLLDEEIILNKDMNLIAKLAVPTSAIYPNMYIEYVYDAYQIINGCCIVKNDIITKTLGRDADDNILKVWKDGETYHYTFCPEFAEITFAPSVNKWD